MSNKRQKPERIDYYAQGQDAAHTNQSAADCPYNFSSPEGEQWLLGYQDGGGTD